MTQNRMSRRPQQALHVTNDRLKSGSRLSTVLATGANHRNAIITTKQLDFDMNRLALVHPTGVSDDHMDMMQMVAENARMQQEIDRLAADNARYRREETNVKEIDRLAAENERYRREERNVNESSWLSKLLGGLTQENELLKREKQIVAHEKIRKRMHEEQDERVAKRIDQDVLEETQKEAKFESLEVKFRQDATKKIQSDVNGVDTSNDEKWVHSMKTLYERLNNEAVKLWDDRFVPKDEYHSMKMPTPGELLKIEQDYRDMEWRLVFLVQNLDDWGLMLYRADDMDILAMKKIVIEDKGFIKHGATTPATLSGLKKNGPRTKMEPRTSDHEATKTGPLPRTIEDDNKNTIEDGYKIDPVDGRIRKVFGYNGDKPIFDPYELDSPNPVQQRMMGY